MAQIPQNKEAMADLGRRLTALRGATGIVPMSWQRMAAAIWKDQGIQVSHETLRKMHRGEVDPAKAMPEHLIAVAKFYGVSSADLGPAAEHRLQALMALAQNWKVLTAA